MNSFTKGFFCLGTALRFVLTHPSVWPFMILPFLCSASFFVGMAFLWGNIQGSLISYIPPGYWWSWLVWFCEVFSWVFFAFISSYLFSLVGMILATPFNDFLCVKVLKMRDLKNIREPGLWEGAVESLKEVLKSTGVKLVLFIFTLFIPGLSIVLFPCFIAWDYFDYPWSHKTVGLRAKFSLIRLQPLTFLGFAFSFSLLFAVPFLGIILMPLAVVGASLVADYEEGSAELAKNCLAE
ncbi:MAG: EI24 domain-containing protein [Planctomycetes bacterium]|nr:EI24 domain-containing protein [Planctomycetota bacterium]